MLLCGSSILFAQTPPPAGETQQPQSDQVEPVTEEITVVGLAESLREAVKVKRESAAIVDVVAAKDVDKLPDRNLAEAVQRVPGVVINREFGEGERVSLRGVAPNLVNTTVNGHNVAVADWFVLEQLAATRSFNYLLLPSELIGLLTVYKSPTAELNEGGIGGTIDVKTRKPLDLKPLAISGSVQAAYTDKSGSYDPNVSALISWKNSQGNLGVLFSTVFDKREIRRDGVEVLGYFPQSGTGLLVPALIGSALFQQERERKAFNAELQFRPAPRLEVNLNGFWSRFGADNINQNYLAWGSQALGGGGTLTDATIVGNTAVAGVISSAANGTQGRGVVFDAIDRKAFAKTWYGDFDATFTPNDSWIVHFDGGYTQADGDTEAQPFVEFGAPATFRYDLRGGAPQVQFLNINPQNPGHMEFDFASLHHITNDDSEVYSYVDAEKVLKTTGPLTSLKFGLKYTDHERETDFQATTYGGFFLPLLATGCGGHTCTAADFAAGLTPGDFLDGVSIPGTLASYWSVDRSRVQDILFDSFNGARIPNPPEVFSVQERVTGGFIMGNLKFANWKGNVGLRAVRTEQTSTGNIVGGAGEIQNAFGNFTHVTADRSYTDLLPSFNLSRDLSPQLVLRIAAARTMARPDFTDVSPRVTLNPGALTGQGGDPDIDPYRANQADVSLEWYHGDDEIVSGALFYKDIQSFITDRPVQQAHLIQTDNPNTSLCTPAFTSQFPNRHSCQFTINQRVNGGGGSVKGMELSALKKLGGGFGFQGNFTYSNAEADDAGLEIPGNSEHSGNLVGFFENNRFSARLAYSYRSEFFVTFDRSTRLNQDALKSLDASLAFNVFRGLAFTVDGVNLTDEKIVQFASDRFRPRAVYDNGRYYFIGFRFQG
ncbi:MAG TPA: TonB-dependent receptor [Thermoanaerobaculia bacterium]|jgi:iron complex outermembrane receptor protein|nr:TonB-dependent receptor [Thermoanaerobaculia bacterium]